MINEKDEELKEIIAKSIKNKKKKLTQEEYEKQIVEWQLFYLNNLDIFTEDYLEIPLRHFQRTLLNDCWENDIEDIIASRGLSKSFIIGILANDLALLLPGINILITSMTLGQSNKIIDEKIDVILSGEKKGISPVLKQLRADGYITFKSDKTGEGRIVEYGNGSKIFAVCCGEGGRSNRSNIVITDESRLVKKTDYDSIIEPTLEPYNFHGLFLEPKQFFITSARTKDNWMWTHLKNTVRNHYTNKKIKYGFFGGDIFTAVANKIQTKKQYITRKENTNDLDFEMEFLNLWLGESLNSLFKYEDFHNNQVLTQAFYPRTPLEYLDGKENNYKFNDVDDVRYLTMDIAVSSGRENDNSSYILGAVDLNNKRKRLEYITTKNGLNSISQVILIKRLFYEYKCSYFVMDSRGIGNVFFDMLTIPTEDTELGITYPAWTVCTDKRLQISSDTVIKDKIERTLSTNAEPVIIPITSTTEINSAMHLSARKSLRDGKVDLLKDDAEMELYLSDKNKKWITLSSEEKTNLLMPYLETHFLVNEAITLNAEFKSDNVKVKEDRSATKDRYMTFAMFNYFGDKLLSKYEYNEYDDDYNEIDYSFLTGDYSAY